MYLDDQHLREQALNPSHSCLVQAPAGSGKTELLTQRFLTLLPLCEKPEDIVAITFTRKAAGEMRQRLIHALSQESQAETSQAPHKKMTRHLARQVLKKDQQHNWNLIENPNRLRILTIDALCASICAQTPLLSQLGGQPSITEDPNYFYQLASRAFLTDTSHDLEVREKLERLLLHMDNRVYQLQALFSHILSKREQWLSHIMRFNSSPDLLKKHLEKALAAISKEAILKLESLFSRELKAKIISLLEFSEARHDPQLENKKASSAQTSKNELSLWQKIANLLLTQNGSFRKMVNKNLGFPPKHPMKTQMEALLQDLNENETLRHALYELQQCPPAHYSEHQWDILEALLVILPRLTAELHIIFAEHAAIDFVEFSLRANFALGTDENPTDLALYLDHRIQHLLIDEFQDTSITQFNLIEKLMAGWVPGDGRSIFLVGDPMQSIYRFREANVGLFLRAQKQGIGGIPLHFIPLSTNFRSDPELVEWFNQHFPKLFPTYSDITTGAVPYSPAVSAKEKTPHSGIFFHPHADGVEEAECVAKLIQGLQKKNPENTIAILVRSRSQLLEIFPVLNRHHIQYHALEIESLGDRPEIQDVLTLTRALLHLADRLSWLALLRTPFCGLKLADLHALSQAASHRSLWEVMLSFQNAGGGNPIPNLSDDANERLQKIVPILHHSLKQKGRLPLAQWVEGTWRALSGPLVLQENDAAQNTAVFFEILAKLDEAHQGLALKHLNKTIQSLSATPKTPGNHPIQVMTIHKAKGLEFDHVILPGLNKTAAQDQHQLLLWLERANATGGSDLLLAPIKAAEEENDPIYGYLRKVEKHKAQHELIRLLYVALTRAKISAHGLAALQRDDDKPEEFLRPSAGSFLALLWDAFFPFLTPNQNDSPSQAQKSTEPAKWMRILHSAMLKSPPLLTEMEKRIENRPPLFHQKNPAIIGTLIHLALEKLALGKKMPEAFWRNQAMTHGLPSTEFDVALRQIHLAIKNMQEDERGQWILKPRASAGNEISISYYQDGAILPLVIDRSFCDENGIRWIIDYKTSTPQGEDFEVFLNQEAERYAKKLGLYAKAFSKIDPRPIRLALYFPLIPYYLEIEEHIYAL